MPPDYRPDHVLGDILSLRSFLTHCNQRGHINCEVIQLWNSTLLLVWYMGVCADIKLDILGSLCDFVHFHFFFFLFFLHSSLSFLEAMETVIYKTGLSKMTHLHSEYDRQVKAHSVFLVKVCCLRKVLCTLSGRLLWCG